MLLLSQRIEEAISTPFPICFAQLHKLLLLAFLTMFPFVVDENLGPAGKVFFPTLTAFIYFGIEHVAIEIEVAFGEDQEDINILRNVRVFESECMSILHSTA